MMLPGPAQTLLRAAFASLISSHMATFRLGEERGSIAEIKKQEMEHNFGFCNSHKVRKEASRIYKTAEAALAASDYEILYLRYVREIARLNHEAGWVCDWSDGDQLKKSFAVFRDMLHEANTHLWQYVATELHFHESAAPKLRELFTGDELKQIIRGHV